MNAYAHPHDDYNDLELDADACIDACDGDARAAVKALLVANAFLESELAKAQAKISTGYARGANNKKTQAGIKPAKE